MPGRDGSTTPHYWGLKIFKVTSKNVIPAKAGIQKLLTLLDSCRSLPRTGYGAGVTNWKLLEVLLFVEVHASPDRQCGTHGSL